MVSPTCYGEGCGYICYTIQLFLHCGDGGFPHSVVLPLPIQCVACRGLAVQEWNLRVGSGIGVTPVIGQYFGLGCFSTARWPEQHCHCPRNPGGLCSPSLSSLRGAEAVLHLPKITDLRCSKITCPWEAWLYHTY